MEIKKMNDLKYAFIYIKRRYTAVTLLTRWGVIFVN